MLLLYPGQVGPLVSLQDARREVHEQERVLVAKEIETRKRFRTPMEDGTDWASLSDLGAHVADAVRACDAGRVRKLAEEALTRVSAPLEEMGEYEPSERLDGLVVRFRVLSEARRRTLLGEVNDSGVRAAGLTGAAAVAADEEGMRAIGAFILEAVAELHGLQVLDEQGREVEKVPVVDEALIEALRLAGLVGPLFRCARAFQELPAKKAMRFGSSPPSTSRGATTAAAATSPDGARSAATAELVEAFISTAPAMRPTAAPVANSSTTPTSQTPSLLRAPWESIPASRPPSG